MPRTASPPDSPAASTLPARLYVAGGLLAAILYVADVSQLLSGLTFIVVAVAGVVALVVGPRWHRTELRNPWTLLAAAIVVFTAGALLRPWASVQTGVAELAADMFTVPGYLLMLLSLTGLLRARRAIEKHAVIDGLIVCVGMAIVSILLFAVPAASISDRSAVVSALAGVYPLFDTVLVLLVVNLAFTTAARRPSYLLLVATMTGVLIGDVAYAIIGRTGHLTGSPLLDLPFLFSFAFIGAAALHPSMVELGRATPLPVQAWSWPRLMLIVPALAVPFLLTVLLPDKNVVHRVVIAIGGVAMVVLLLARAVSAVQAYAAAQRLYQHQATHDALTQLPNRTTLPEQVGKLLRAPAAPGAMVWVFFLDLDGFKRVNDSWGHAAGDQLIVEVARRLRTVVPAPATVARVGGDEFVMVDVGSRDAAVALAERVLDCFGAPLSMPFAQVVITASVGIAGRPVDAGTQVTADDLMREADTAMYQAKSEGPGKWTMFDSSMHQRVRERVDIEVDLRKALPAETSDGSAVSPQLHLAYQPIVELRTGGLLGAEALIRWNHPARGAIPPGAFIPIAEDTGLIAKIGRWVLRESVRQLAEWRRTGTVTDDFWISVNVSPRQLRDPHLPDVLASTLTDYGVPPRVVVLEITESVMIDASAVTDEVLRQMRELGVRIVVDDFGTGYSALGYLRRHPVTGVKIDRAFVRGLGVDAEDEEIVRAVTAMSSALGLTVVAEGVETPTQQGVLAELGVVMGQGMLWSAPIGPVRFGERWSALRSLPALPPGSPVVPSRTAGTPATVPSGPPTPAAWRGQGQDGVGAS
ncbi:putative bifunctional diguanylate cyclase/phosphodiesterase [Polymorphospora rubra]|uniref:putative bifunctional diguanylate cyclase/phosphodiesterase n=1 Tax=Polymorphospora rubra TaxID=338584 RepID=UPI0033FD3E53